MSSNLEHNMPFAKGDQVRSKKRGIVGMIKGLDVVHGGIQYYEVFWGGDRGLNG